MSAPWSRASVRANIEHQISERKGRRRRSSVILSFLAAAVKMLVNIGVVFRLRKRYGIHSLWHPSGLFLVAIGYQSGPIGPDLVEMTPNSLRDPVRILNFRGMLENINFVTFSKDF